MHDTVLLLGSNLGNRKEIIYKAITLLSGLGELGENSSFYESEAWGFESGDNFLNIAMELKTDFDAQTLLKKIHIIENKLGRERIGKGYSSRTIDIDILFYDDKIIKTKTLIIPHPSLHKRMFALKCLMDFMPNYQHPTLGNTIGELIEKCTDKSKIWLYE